MVSILLGDFLPLLRVIALGLALFAARCVGATENLDRAIQAIRDGDYHRAQAELIRPAERGDPEAQYLLGEIYYYGFGVQKDAVEAAKWFLRAAEQSHGRAEALMALLHMRGDGVRLSLVQAARWARRAADHGNPDGQFMLGMMYSRGEGVQQSEHEATSWILEAAKQGHADAQFFVAGRFFQGKGVRKSLEYAFLYWSLAQRQGKREATDYLSGLPSLMAPEELARARKLLDEWRPETAKPRGVSAKYGSGFYVTRTHVLTNYHVVDGCSLISLGSTFRAHVVAKDTKNDLALLQTDERSTEVAELRVISVPKLGEPILVVGFPLPGVLADGVQVTSGTISALAGPRNDTTLLQITAPVQPGNSGGPLVDQSGRVIGVVVAKLDAIAVARSTGDIPQNVNFAINASTLRSFLEHNHVSFKSALTSSARIGVEAVAARATQFAVSVQCKG